MQSTIEPLNNDLILETLVSNKKQLASFGVKEIGLFGSYVHNEQTAGSDIDFLVDIVPGKRTFRNFMALVYYLEELFGKEVEVVTRQSLSPFIGPHILKTVQCASLAD